MVVAQTYKKRLFFILKDEIKMVKKIIYNLFDKLQRQTEDYMIRQNLKRLNISDTVKVYESAIIGNVEIGEYTYINPYSVVSSGIASKVVIGKHCSIGRYVSITSRAHSLALPTSDEDHKMHEHIEQDTIIGNYVWIGDHVFIKHGVKVSDYAIIGAGSVVTKDVKPFEIVGGVPARHIRFNEEHYRFQMIKDRDEE